MKPRIAWFVVALVVFAASGDAFAQTPVSDKTPELRREIARVRAAIAELSERLKGLEKQLAEAEAGAPFSKSKLLFPVEVERAMLGEGENARRMEPFPRQFRFLPRKVDELKPREQPRR